MSKAALRRGHSAVLHIPTPEGTVTAAAIVHKANPYNDTAMVDVRPRPTDHPLRRIAYCFDSLAPGLPIRLEQGQFAWTGLLVRGYGPRMSLRALAPE